MKRATETRVTPRSWVVLAATLVVLAGCDEALLSEGASDDAKSDAAQNDGPTELFANIPENRKDSVEAPEVFQVAEAGLWDGRPSLGGVWVAHPDVTQPERVVIKNAANNKTVTGALFRRERNLPGPALQLSSAAAEELGILAGSPTTVEVVALRRKPVEEEKPEPEEVEIASAEEPAAEEVTPEADSTETAEAEVEKPAKRKWWQKKETAAAATAAGAGAAVAAADTATEAPAEVTEEVIETAAEAAPTANLSDPTVTPPAEKPAKRKWWQKKPADEITETPLDPIEGAAAAIEAAEPTSASTTQTTSSSSVSKPYVQVGTFYVEDNAQSAVNKIKRNGLSAEVRETKSGDKTVWRVLVGPAKTRAERNALQSDVKDLGFTDAFSVKN
ncbi:SPOR domain-containing protein [Ruegeria sp.]|uniref:SPOR domain-containing protein n=1 Tax=Ruegeria sp. TaxID=1879320 RepID=UPI003B5A6407